MTTNTITAHTAYMISLKDDFINLFIRKEEEILRKYEGEIVRIVDSRKNVHIGELITVQIYPQAGFGVELVASIGTAVDRSSYDVTVSDIRIASQADILADEILMNLSESASEEVKQKIGELMKLL